MDFIGILLFFALFLVFSPSISAFFRKVGAPALADGFPETWSDDTDRPSPLPKRPELSEAPTPKHARVFVDAEVESHGVSRPTRWDYIPEAPEHLLRFFPESEIICREPLVPSDNGLLGAALYAYAEHQGLVLAPETVLHTIMHGIARFIFKGDQLEIDPEKRAGIESILVTDDLPFTTAEIAKTLSENLVASDPFAAQVKDAIASLPAYVAHQAAFDVQLLAAFNARYEYRLCGWACGIRRIEVEGSEAEWLALANAVRQLRGMSELEGLTAWLTTVEAILERLASFNEDDEASRAFMRKIVSYKKGCCSPSMVSGWIANFFPYLKGELRTEFPVEGSDEEFFVHELNDHLRSEAEVMFTYGPTGETFPIKLVTRLKVKEGTRGDLNLLRPTVETGIWTDESRVQYYAH